jgi:hypothetical protein
MKTFYLLQSRGGAKSWSGRRSPAARHSSPSGRACAKRRGSGCVVTPGQPLGFPRGSWRVVPRTPFRGVVIPVRAAWRPLPRPASAAAPPAAGPARRGAWPAASPARRSDRRRGRRSVRSRASPLLQVGKTKDPCGGRAGRFACFLYRDDGLTHFL